MNRLATREPVKMFSLDDMRLEGVSLSMATEHGPESREQDEAAALILQVTPCGRLCYCNPLTWVGIHGGRPFQDVQTRLMRLSQKRVGSLMGGRCINPTS